MSASRYWLSCVFWFSPQCYLLDWLIASGNFLFVCLRAFFLSFSCMYQIVLEINLGNSKFWLALGSGSLVSVGLLPFLCFNEGICVLWYLYSWLVGLFLSRAVPHPQNRGLSDVTVSHLLLLCLRHQLGSAHVFPACAVFYQTHELLQMSVLDGSWSLPQVHKALFTPTYLMVSKCGSSRM